MYEMKQAYRVMPSFRGFGAMPGWWSTADVVAMWKNSIDSSISATKRNTAGARMAIRLKAALSQLGYAVKPQLEGAVAWGKEGGAALAAYAAKVGLKPAPGNYPTKPLITQIGDDLAAGRVSGPSAPVEYLIEDQPGGAMAVPVTASQPATATPSTTSLVPSTAAPAAVPPPPGVSTPPASPPPTTAPPAPRTPPSAPPAAKPPVVTAAGMSTNMKLGLGVGAVLLLGLAVALTMAKKKPASATAIESAPKQLPAATPNRRRRRHARFSR